MRNGTGKRSPGLGEDIKSILMALDYQWLRHLRLVGGRLLGRAEEEISCRMSQADVGKMRPYV